MMIDDMGHFSPSPFLSTFLPLSPFPPNITVPPPPSLLLLPPPPIVCPAYRSVWLLPYYQDRYHQGVLKEDDEEEQAMRPLEGREGVCNDGVVVVVVVVVIVTRLIGGVGDSSGGGSIRDGKNHAGGMGRIQ